MDTKRVGLGGSAVAALVIAAQACCAIASHAQVLPTVPSWSSAEAPQAGGAGMADIDGDGWLDLVVAVGSSVIPGPVAVYRNDGAGRFNDYPTWLSSDLAYNGQVEIADVNADGWPDVAVACLVPLSGPSARLYLNNAGTLSLLPVWRAPLSLPSTSIAFGDVNADGRPDLAVASGDPIERASYRNCVYLNVAGSLSKTVSWETSAPRNSTNCLWLDADRDGKLDLLYTGAGSPVAIYRNSGLALQTTPAWQYTTAPYATMAAEGDVTRDGRRDLILADNSQLFAGTGKFQLLSALPGPAYAPAPSWTFNDGYGGAVTLADIDDDGRRDLFAGAWYGPVRCFLDRGDGFQPQPDWTSIELATASRLVLADVDRTALESRVDYYPNPAGRRLYYLTRQPADILLNVIADGVALAPNQYTWSRESGWVSIGVSPTVEVAIHYSYSHSLDLVVASSSGAFPLRLYSNDRSVCVADFNFDGFIDAIDLDQFLILLSVGRFEADINVDGFVDALDLDRFVAAFLSGC